MRITRYTPTATAIHLGVETVYFSYDTLVAYSGPLGRFRTDRARSNTTSKHMGIMGVATWEKRPQEWFDNLDASVMHAEAGKVLGS